MTGPVILVVGARPNFMKIAPIHAELAKRGIEQILLHTGCLLYTSPSPRDRTRSRMPSSA